MHNNELQYLSGPPPGNAAQQRLSATMVRYRTRFAHTGDPNGPGHPTWTPVQHGATAQRLAPAPPGIVPTDVAALHHCAMRHDVNNTWRMATTRCPWLPLS